MADEEHAWIPLRNERSRYFTIVGSILGIILLAGIFANSDEGRTFWGNMLFQVISFILAIVFIRVVNRPKYGWKYENKYDKNRPNYFGWWVAFSPFVFLVLGKEYAALQALTLIFQHLLLYPQYRD